MPLSMTSRERMPAALDRKERDHVPCAFMSFSAMRGRCQDPYEVCDRELEMGLDTWLFIPATWRNLRPQNSDFRSYGCDGSAVLDGQYSVAKTSVFCVNSSTPCSLQKLRGISGSRNRVVIVFSPCGGSSTRRGASERRRTATLGRPITLPRRRRGVSGSANSTLVPGQWNAEF
jgi:hypothetical protein